MTEKLTLCSINNAIPHRNEYKLSGEEGVNVGESRTRTAFDFQLINFKPMSVVEF